MSWRRLESFSNLYKKNVRNFSKSGKKIVSCSDEVIAAKKSGKPIVALESTIITHGMPYPHNLDTALKVEEVIRQKGVIPATIAVINGQVRVGCDKSELEKLSNSQDVTKVSRRDFAYVVSKGLNGGTTVSGTMTAAKLAGIPIMATGGIGGVHRGSELSMDVSADLEELSQTRVAVVCSGVKAILDIPKTLEYLETKRVPVATIGTTDKFPAFYSRETFDGLKSPMRLSSVEEAAHLIAAQTQLKLESGILLAVPIPESVSLDPWEIEEAIKKALELAKLNNISGKNVTPFLLEEMSKITVGRTLESNKALIKHNAEVAAEIALHLARMQSSTIENVTRSTSVSQENKNPVVIGGSTFDTILQVKEEQIVFNGSTHRGQSRRTCGGVGRNLAAALVNLGMTGTKLLSVVGDDEAGKAVVKSLQGADETLRTLFNVGTARYTAVIDDKGDCCFGIGEMEAFDKIDKSLIEEHQAVLEKSSFILLDGNPSLDAMQLVLEIAERNQIPVWFEPTDLHKAVEIFKTGTTWQKVLRFISPNIIELFTIAKYFQIPLSLEDKNLETIKQTVEFVAEFIPVVIATLGSDGVMVARRSSADSPFQDANGKLIESGKIESRLYSPIPTGEPAVSVSGCGDCLAAGIVSGIFQNLSESDCLTLGLRAAALSLASTDTVPNSLGSLRNTLT